MSLTVVFRGKGLLDPTLGVWVVGADADDGRWQTAGATEMPTPIVGYRLFKAETNTFLIPPDLIVEVISEGLVQGPWPDSLEA